MAQAELEKTLDVSAEKLLKVISDYEKYPEFVEGMKSVKIARSASGEITGHYQFSMMGKEMSYDLKLKENMAAGIVEWSLLKSDFFKVNNGKWTIKSTGPSSCHVTYGLEVEFSIPVPGFLLKGVVKNTLPSMVENFYKRTKKIG